jgi:hypothetical protein
MVPPASVELPDTYVSETPPSAVLVIKLAVESTTPPAVIEAIIAEVSNELVEFVASSSAH